MRAVIDLRCLTRRNICAIQKLHNIVSFINGNYTVKKLMGILTEESWSRVPRQMIMYLTYEQINVFAQLQYEVEYGPRTEWF